VGCGLHPIVPKYISAVGFCGCGEDTGFQSMKFESFQAIFCTLKVIQEGGFYMVRAVTVALILTVLIYITSHNSSVT